MKKSDWIWMPHAAHFICGKDCQFHLATFVGNFIVSTVGELWSDQDVRRIHAEVHDPEWYRKNKNLKGDYFDAAYMKKFGFRNIGHGRKYETMVFVAEKSKEKCCPFIQESGNNLDFEGYNSAESAMKGHMKMCKKWARRKTSERRHHCKML